ncbi:ATP synthase I [Bacillus sp. SA1-12]|uniref:ATP synthase subunit I n=1 Tax=Bacillus sp. SA1-12 TaxID=1455638 RepID=UPI00062738F3|nr:ATP synthase subunit I [Bacillus sp. SA1-12]KKI89699.1 ATP synthase I [Bacillus sp. SA1-12]
MNDVHLMYRRYRSYIFYLLSFYVLGWGLTDYQSVFLGLILGTSISLYHLWIMVRKNVQFGRALKENRRIRSLGTSSRFATAAIATLITLKFPEMFHLVSLIIGIMTIYIVIMIDYVIQQLRM